MRVLSPRNTLLAPLGVRDFALFSVAMLVSQSAGSVYALGRVWLVQDTTHSPFMVGLVAALTGLPVLVFSIFGGYLGDRFSRRGIVIGMEGLTIVSAALLAALAWTGAVQTWHILGTSLLQGVAAAISMPVRQTMVTDLVPPAQQRGAIGLSMLTGNVAGIIGPAIGGVLLTFYGSAPTMAVGAAAAVFALPVYFMLKPGSVAAAGRSPTKVWQGLKEGIRYSASEPTIRWLLVVSVIILTSLSTRGVVFPGIVQDEMGLGAGSLGMLELAGGIGALFGPLISIALNRWVSDIKLLVWVGFIFAATVALMAVSPWLAMLALFSGITTLIGQVFFVTNWSAMQVYPEQEFRARVVSVRYFTSGVRDFGILALGALAQWIGPREALLVFVAVGTVLFAFTIALLMPRRKIAPPALNEAREST